MEHMEEFTIPKEAKERLSNPKILHDLLSKGKTFQEIIGYSFATMEKFYSRAHHLYQDQRYEDAADAFMFLTTLNPNVHNYWLGLGMSEHMNEEYDAALIAYGMAIMTDVENPLPHYHSASCYNALQDKENALAAVELAIAYAGDKPEHAPIKQRALAAKDFLRSGKV